MGRNRKRASRPRHIEAGSRWEWEHLITDDNRTNSDDGAEALNPDSEQLGELFHGLTSEVRDEIFAQLLVRPVKWDVEHQAECEKRRKVPPHESIRPQFEHSYWPEYTCASRMRPNTDLDTQLSRLPVWRDPWLSRWAPEQINKWVCTLCWTARLRPRPFPETWSLPCLCARFGQLQVLLVCRQWYDEASTVFWTRNTFAFAQTGECVNFFESLPRRLASLISKVSLRVLPANDKVPLDTRYELSITDIEVEGDGGLGHVWVLLAELSSLTDLELDALFLTNSQAVRILRRPGPRGLRRVHFTQNRLIPWQCRIEHRARSDYQFGELIPRPIHGNIHLKEVQRYVWPSQHHRKFVDDSEFATNIARSIKGLRHEGDNDYSKDDAAEVFQEKERYIHRLCSDVPEVVMCEQDV
ncbi:hypothetical protein PG995_005108 [Apiospora arundinis]